MTITNTPNQKKKLGPPGDWGGFGGRLNFDKESKSVAAGGPSVSAASRRRSPPPPPPQKKK